MNLLFWGCALPSIAVFVIGFTGFFGGFAIMIAVAAAFPIGGAYSACAFCVTKMLRDEPRDLRYDFARKLRENIKAAALPGIMVAAFVYTQIFMWGFILFGDGGTGVGWVAVGLVSLLIVWMTAPYVFLQIAYLDLSVPQVLRNSALITLANAPRSFMGMLAGASVWLAFILFLPGSLIFAPLIFLFALPLSWLSVFMWIWPPVDKQFAIDETLRKRRSEN